MAMTLIGELSLWVALLMAAWTTVVSFVGGRQQRADLLQSGERATYATLGFVLLASLGICTALFARDFSYKLVVSHSSVTLATAYTASAFWAAESGALLLCANIAALYGAIAVSARRHLDRQQRSWITGTLGAISCFLLLAVCFASNPYERVEWVPADGGGLTPALQNAAVAMYRPITYLGLLATTVPFACSIGGLATRTPYGFALDTIRRWMLGSWVFLTIGVLLGMRWTYIVSGTATYWTPGAVETLVLVPWLTSAATLSGLPRRATGEAHGVASLGLVAITFAFAIIVIALTANGVPASVHDSLQSPVLYASSAFLLVSLVTFWHLVSTRSMDLIAMPVSGVDWQRHRAGGVLLGVGIVVCLCALAGQRFRKDRVISVKTGERITAVDALGHAWTFRSLGLSRFEEPNRRVLAASFDVGRDAMPQGLLSSEIDQYIDSEGEPRFAPFTRVATRVSLTQDVYVVFSGSDDADSVTGRIAFVPLASWVWWGGLILLCGGLVRWWPAARRDSVRDNLSASVAGT
jgi:cytochrome c biogenesis factor